MKFPESALAHKYCIGKGLEIGGAAHNPFGLDTLNIDIEDSPNTILKQQEKDYCGESMPVDIVADGGAIPLSANSQDFIVSSHVLEHFPDPVSALLEWDRLIKPNGIIFMIVPHKDRTFDCDSPRTTLQHLIDDYNNKETKPHHHTKQEHDHVWITEDIVELIHWMIGHFKLNWEIVETRDSDDKAGIGFTVVIRKRKEIVNMKVGICAIMKDVYEPYLQEWLEHHRSIGIDYFFIYDNESEIPTVIDGEDVIVERVFGKARQIPVYEQCLFEMKSGILPHCDRLAFIDEDEFIRCESGDIKQTLSEYSDYPAIGLSWRVFGSSGLKLKTPEPQQSKFTQFTHGHPYENHIKSIVDPSRTICSSGTPHDFKYSSGNCVNVDKDPIEGPFSAPIYRKIWIDHYYTRSLEEWKEKIAKGRSDIVTADRDFRLIDEIDASCSAKPRQIHLMMPFSRKENWDKLIASYGSMNIILHPLTLANENVSYNNLPKWVIPFVSSADEFNQSSLLNEFIQTTSIIDNDFYVSVSDDDMYDQDVFQFIRNMSDPVVVVSMKRGYRVPHSAPKEKKYPPTTLLAQPENMRVGCVGGEQIFMKGSVLKTVYFNTNAPMIADGLVAEAIKSYYPIRYEPTLFALFNYYEPERWKMLDGGISFGCMVNDLMRIDMVLKQSQIDPAIQCYTVLNPESATKGLNKLLDIIEHTGADVAILVHQDMYFRNGWTDQIKSQIKLLPANWIAAGVIGKDHTGIICGKFHDMRIPDHFDTSDIHIFPHEVCCFDEAVIIINLKSKFRFDETMAGFDLYGTLAVLQAWEMGGSAWVLDAFCEHFCMRPFTWRPDKLFIKNYKWLFDKFNSKWKILDSTALGLSSDAEERLQQMRQFMTSAAAEE